MNERDPAWDFDRMKKEIIGIVSENRELKKSIEEMTSEPSYVYIKKLEKKVDALVNKVFEYTRSFVISVDGEDIHYQDWSHKMEGWHD